ncbi:hypothetical protein HYH02_005413 [Chlamydomonas schloesseri]|uniref:TatD related DNase n=1 Tax=Chlamydomonas schloesseri TaxID=2026947 RepID=A0A835WLZ6_9CHLO|nr:hypothetical protein HYH02_005413 [Chlamydomonas schloesseri]|eukprot:KAG2449891.1 hypothetical protein HYH02_005413 [Chlamydomonas schloesseri]
MTATAATADTSLLRRFGIGDAHCHPQDDAEDCARRLLALAAPHVAVMGTRLGDWGEVEALAAAAPHKVIPCFGVHPWFAHRHALRPEQAAAPAALLDAPSNGRDSPDRHPQLLAALGPGGDMAVAAPEEWLPRLRELLARHPHALVGEFGLDRAAVVPGTRLQPGWEHQLALTEAHLRLAAELGRPVSMHCVQGYGHLQVGAGGRAGGWDMLRRLGPAGCPPKIMLHSYGGSVDLIKGFTKMPGGLGERIYFSFSDVINGRKPGQREKLLERLAAVPAGRLLLESDQNSPAGIDSGLVDILGAVAEARGVSVDAAAEAAAATFRDFFDSCLSAMPTAAAAGAAGGDLGEAGQQGGGSG